MHWFTAPRCRGYWECVGAKIVHYSSTPKPWDSGAKKGELELLWWRYLLEFQTGMLLVPASTPPADKEEEVRVDGAARES